RTGTVTDLISGSQIITFTNSSPAMGFNSSGVLVQPTANVPFIEYDPATGACLGWRVWDGVTNLKSYSEAVLVANGYGATNATLATQSVSTPIQGVSSASFFALNSGANTGNNTDGMSYGSSISLANSTAYTQSALFKLSGTNTIRLRSNVTGQVFDIVPASGATTPTGTITACTVQAAPNGWYRVSWSFTSTTSAPGNRGDHWTIKTPVADGTTGLWITGTQINTGPLAPYVPTGALTASSTADVASITGAAFAGIWNPNEATFFSDTEVASTSQAEQTCPSVNDGTSANRMDLRVVGASPTMAKAVFVAGAVSQGVLTVTVPDQKRRLSALAMKVNDSRLQCGSAGANGNPSALPVVDRMYINFSTGAFETIGYIREMGLFKSRRPNANLQAMMQ
ncbi:MAG: phage head spike fiber domain-containing protein, partial [Prochlorococcaceae cyanobacterium]